MFRIRLIPLWIALIASCCCCIGPQPGDFRVDAADREEVVSGAETE